MRWPWCCGKLFSLAFMYRGAQVEFISQARLFPGKYQSKVSPMGRKFALVLTQMQNGNLILVKGITLTAWTLDAALRTLVCNLHRAHAVTSDADFAVGPWLV